MMRHELKIATEYFEAVASGEKNFEIRRNDRGYARGDVLRLREYNVDTGYTGRLLTREVTYMTDYGQVEDYVVLGLKDVVDGALEALQRAGEDVEVDVSSYEDECYV